jgi:hypothetical protein
LNPEVKHETGAKIRITELQLKHIVKSLINEISYEKGMDDEKKVKVDVTQGMKSTPKTKVFKNMAAYEKWADSEDAENYTIERVYQD